MGQSKNQSQKSDFGVARDELFSHIHRCGVLQATPEQQIEWLSDTVDYMGERYPDLSAAELEELKSIGLRFCQPIIPHGEEHTALTEHGAEDASAKAAAA